MSKRTDAIKKIEVPRQSRFSALYASAAAVTGGASGAVFHYAPPLTTSTHTIQDLPNGAWKTASQTHVNSEGVVMHGVGGLIALVAAAFAAAAVYHGNRAWKASKGEINYKQLHAPMMNAPENHR